MKEKVSDKYTALLQATLTLVNNRGFHDTPMSKIAKLAGVSPATIYIYFENKQDLINKLYIEVKASFCSHAFQGYNTELPVKKGFEVIWNNIADYKLNKTEEAMFLSQCDNTPMIDDTSFQKGLKHLQPLLDLWERGKKEGIIKSISPYLLYAYTVYPLSFLLPIHVKGTININESDRLDAFQAAWDSIKV
ncbi:MAG TPA: TetR/AcrR family transcriptional regulator [Paludibacter sp.]|nr:TetR/AcrR family transcriptional regulator [Paludibacter sp.]